jgi:hypothetical protein
MAGFEQVTPDEFDDAIASSPSSRTFKEQYARFRPYRNDHCFIHRGSLVQRGHFAAPGFCTLIIGDLTIDGFVDLDNPEGFDEGGVFIVIGNVRCTAFSGHYGKCTFVDGHLIASELILNAYEDSSLLVTGDLKTRLFYGWDIWAEVGGSADFEYAEGYCLPIGYRAAGAEAIRARRDTPAHLVLDPDILDNRDGLKIYDARQRLRRGASILRLEDDIGRVLAPKLSARGRERLHEFAVRVDAGETVTEIDLRDCELRFVPEEIRSFTGLRRLCISKNNVGELPDWIGEFSALETLEAEDCGLSCIPAAVADMPALRHLLAGGNEITDMPDGGQAWPALERLRIGGGYDDLVSHFTACIDLGCFPRLRVAEQRFGGTPEIKFGPGCDFWDNQSLEFLDFRAVFETLVPPGLAKATALKGLTCGLSKESLGSAIEILPRLPALQVFVVYSGWDLERADIMALTGALPGVYVAVRLCQDYSVDYDSPRYALKSSIDDHLRSGRYSEAAAAAERLFADIDCTKPQFDRDFQERALESWLLALKFAAAGETDASQRRVKAAEAAQMADRILAMLPDDVESCRFAGVAWLRWYSLLAQANRCICQGDPDLAAAKALYDAVHAETKDINNASKERVRMALREAGLDV